MAAPDARRKPELSWLNVIFCLLVVWIHVLSRTIADADPLSLPYGLTLAAQRLSFVSVPGFFLLSGLKLCLRPPEKLLPYYGHRARKILLPYAVAVTIYYLYFVRIGWVTPSPGGYVQALLTGNISAQFYFVVSLALLILLTPLFLRWTGRYDALVMLPVALAVSWILGYRMGDLLEMAGLSDGAPGLLPVKAMLTHLVMYGLGCYIGRNYEDFRALLQRNRAPVLLACAVFTLADGVLSWLHFSGRVHVGILTEFHLGYLLSGLMALFLLAWRLGPLPKPAAVLDRLSYPVYLYHCLVITFFNDRIGPRFRDLGLQLGLRTVFTYGVTIFGYLLLQSLWGRIIKNLKKRGKNHGK